MRTLIDLPEKQINELTAISQAEKISRAEVIREAIACYLATKKPSMDEAFGLWQNRKVDGLAYQENLRSEW